MRNKTVQSKVRNFRGDAGFVKIRRGLREHLESMSSDAVKLYIWLHIAAFWTGKQRGSVETNYAEMQKELHWTKIRARRALADLQPRYVKVQKHGNQHQYTLIRILRYAKKLKSAVLISEHSESGVLTGERNNEQSNEHSRSLLAAKTLTIRTPKKAIEGYRSKAATKIAAASPLKPQDSVWEFLKIHPCGPPDFQQLLETGWASRGSQRPSSVIGDSIDAWEALHGKLNAPSLFRALAELRRNEKTQPMPAAVEEPIHKFTPEEIPA